jgi:hypothetical protein
MATTFLDQARVSDLGVMRLLFRKNCIVMQVVTRQIETIAVKLKPLL